MPNRMELPDEMQHLIEKREAERRAREADEVPAAADDSQDTDRRKGGRRDSDGDE